MGAVLSFISSSSFNVRFGLLHCDAWLVVQHYNVCYATVISLYFIYIKHKQNEWKQCNNTLSQSINPPFHGWRRTNHWHNYNTMLNVLWCFWVAFLCGYCVVFSYLHMVDFLVHCIRVNLLSVNYLLHNIRVRLIADLKLCFWIK